MRNIWFVDTEYDDIEGCYVECPNCGSKEYLSLLSEEELHAEEMSCIICGDIIIRD
jgi:transcription elongation factor Elf1